MRKRSHWWASVLLLVHRTCERGRPTDARSHVGAEGWRAQARGSGYARARTPTLRLHSFSLWERRGTMATLLAFHEVDDVDHWLSSPKREEVFGSLGITVRTFRDREGSNRVGLIVDVPDMAAFEGVMQSEAGADAMKYDGVRPETLLILTEG